MNRIELPEPEFLDVALEPDDRVTLGEPEMAPDAARSRIALARPLTRRLDEAAVDEDTRPFLEEQADRAYYLVAMACSFRHDAAHPFASAWVQVDLRLLNATAAGDVRAWSLEPEQLYDPAEMSHAVEFDPSLKLTGIAGVGVDVGLAGKTATEAHFTRNLVFVEGLGLGTASPSWSFTKTDAHEIRGQFQLRFVAELPAAQQAEGTVSAGATVAQKKLGFSYVAALKELPELHRVTLGAGA